MKKTLFLLLLSAVSGLLVAQNQVVPGETNTNSDVTDTPEQIVFTSVDYLSQDQIDMFWYLADTAKSAFGVVESIYKSGVYVTAVLFSASNPKWKILVCFDWHTGRIERYSVIDARDNIVRYTFQRQKDDSFLSTDPTGGAHVVMKEEDKDKFVSFSRVTVIEATIALSKKISNS